MEKYNYFDNVKEDAMEFAKESIQDNNWKTVEDIDDNEQDMLDSALMSDGVTGNASGSYWFNTWKAEEALCHNTDVLMDALSELGYEDIDTLSKGAETLDVIIRCYVLYEVWAEVVEELKQELEEE